MVMPLLPPEVRLLLLASAPRTEHRESELIALAKSPLNWAGVVRLAAREQLLPVLWSALRAHVDLIPPETIATLQRQSSVTEFRMGMTESVLGQVVERLACEDIRVMLLKGAALATTIYPSFAARPMGDLDMLVAPDQTERAWACMREAGWKPELPGGREFHESHQHLPGLLDPGGFGIVLEIHRSVLPPRGPFVLNEDEIWRDARTVRVRATDAFVPSDEHQLLHLCLHFAWSHALMEGVGRTLRDVATMLWAREINWPPFIELMTRAKGGTCAYWTLAMSHTLASAPVPDSVLDALRPRQPQAVTRALLRAYVVSGLVRSCPSMRLARLLWSAGIRPAASGHGDARPWDDTAQFMSAFHRGTELSVSARLRQHATRLPDWLQFAEALGLPRRVI
ncbi:MAG TPA: nucleotidyltransferase family protein [Gemmatimonadaceae bacterium]|nr:nucleotidyltransferase family protein [Gemmatimonadaceae bacterium]